MSQQIVNNKEATTGNIPFVIPNKVLADSDGGLGLSLIFNLSASSLVVIIIGILIGVIALGF